MAKIPVSYSGRAGKGNRIKAEIRRKEEERKAASKSLLVSPEVKEEVPEAPEAPETPGTPEVPEAPEAPETPETPEVEEEAPEAPEAPETPETPEVKGTAGFSMMSSKAELVQAAKEAGIEVKVTSTKADLLQALQALQPKD